MIFDQVRAKAISRGTPINEDPEFLGWVERWITGEYEVSDLRSRYNDLAARRTQQSTCTRNGGKQEADLGLNAEADIPHPVQDAD